MNFKRGVFKVSINPRALGANEDNGERKGYFDDQFGIHGNRYGWTITHLATGFQCGKATSQAVARVKVGLLRALPIDWASADPLSSIDQMIRAKVREIALAQEVS